MSIRVYTALAAALLALALVPNQSRADDQDTTAGTVICKDGTKVTGSMVQHTGRAECSGRGGIDYTATKALPENQASASTTTPGASSTDSSATAMVRCKDGTSVAHTGADACAAHGGMDHTHTGAMTQSHAAAGDSTPGSESSTASTNAPAAAGAAGAGGAATAATAGESTPGASESTPGTASQTAPHDTHLAQAAAPGGGPGKVWVNTTSKMYHCPEDHAYGKTAHGEYMTEADAKAQGFKPMHGKACE